MCDMLSLESYVVTVAYGYQNVYQPPFIRFTTLPLVYERGRVERGRHEHIFIYSTAPELDSLKLYEKASQTPQFAATDYQ